MGGAPGLISTTVGVEDGTLGAMPSASGAAVLDASPNAETEVGDWPRWWRECRVDVLVGLEQWCGRTSAEPVGHRRRDLLVAARTVEAPTASFAVAAINEPAEVTQCAVKATTTTGTMEAVAGETATAIFPKQSKV
jgi:hypothetical protein